VLSISRAGDFSLNPTGYAAMAEAIGRLALSGDQPRLGPRGSADSRPLDVAGR